jgi:hypothetical protein
MSTGALHPGPFTTSQESHSDYLSADLQGALTNVGSTHESHSTSSFPLASPISETGTPLTSINSSWDSSWEYREGCANVNRNDPNRLAAFRLFTPKEYTFGFRARFSVSSTRLLMELGCTENNGIVGQPSDTALSFPELPDSLRSQQLDPPHESRESSILVDEDYLPERAKEAASLLSPAAVEGSPGGIKGPSDIIRERQARKRAEQEQKEERAEEESMRVQETNMYDWPLSQPMNFAKRGVKCPTCAASGVESWAVMGGICGFCGTACY